MDLCLVIPSHNRADLIIDTIESALNQTKPFSKIIVVDDASTDDTLEKLKQFGNRITVIASTKVGVQEVRNIGVRNAGTPFVMLCDSDDLLEPSHVETVSDWLDAHPNCDAIYTNHYVFTEKFTQEDTFSRAPHDFFENATRDGDFLTLIPDLYVKTGTFQPLLVSGVTLRTAFYLKIGGFDPSFNGVPAEDWEFTLRVLRRGSVTLCTRPLTRIRRHLGNESLSALRQRLGEVAILEHVLTHHDISDRYRQEFTSIIDRHRLWAFEEAFGTKKLRLAAAIFPHLGQRRDSLKFRVKGFLIRLYMIATNYHPPSADIQYTDAMR